MFPLTDLELVPSEQAESKSAFADQREYETFCRDFYDAVKPDLDANAEARRQSEEAATRRWLR